MTRKTHDTTLPMTYTRAGRKRDEWDELIEQMFAEMVEAGEFVVTERDDAGRPIKWRGARTTTEKLN
jgi:hypothetical protein